MFPLRCTRGHRHLNSCLCDRGFSEKFQQKAFFLRCSPAGRAHLTIARADKQLQFYQIAHICLFHQLIQQVMGQRFYGDIGDRQQQRLVDWEAKRFKP